MNAGSRGACENLSVKDYKKNALRMRLNAFVV